MTMTMGTAYERRPAAIFGEAASNIARHGGTAPSRFDRLENDHYFTLDADWIVPALLSKVPIKIESLDRRPRTSRARIPPARFQRRQWSIRSTKIRWCRTSQSATCDRSYRSPGSIGRSATCPHDQDALAAHLVALGARDRCGVALLTRSEWIVARKRCQLVHEHPNFAGILQLTTRPRWSENSPRHNFVGAIWGAKSEAPRRGSVGQIRRSPVAPSPLAKKSRTSP